MKNIIKFSLNLKSLGLLFLAFNLSNAQAQTGEIKYKKSIFPEENGKIESIGDVTIEYYRSIFPELNGKIKSIGGTNIAYYRNISPEENGKIKSITGKTGSDFIASPLRFYKYIMLINRQKTERFLHHDSACFAPIWRKLNRRENLSVDNQ